MRLPSAANCARALSRAGKTPHVGQLLDIVPAQLPPPSLDLFDLAGHLIVEWHRDPGLRGLRRDDARDLIDLGLPFPHHEVALDPGEVLDRSNFRHGEGLEDVIGLWPITSRERSG